MLSFLSQRRSWVSSRYVVEWDVFTGGSKLLLSIHPEYVRTFILYGLRVVTTTGVHCAVELLHQIKRKSVARDIYHLITRTGDFKSRGICQTTQTV